MKTEPDKRKRTNKTGLPGNPPRVWDEIAKVSQFSNRNSMFYTYPVHFKPDPEPVQMPSVNRAKTGCGNS